MPIDPTKVQFKEGSDKEWALLPEDTYQVQITDITEDQAEWQGVSKPVLKFEFTVIEQNEFEDNGRKCYTYGRKLWKKGSIVAPLPSHNNKDPLTYRVVSAVVGHKLTKEEGEHWTIDKLNTLIGKQLRVSVTQSAPKPDGKQFNNIEGFLAVKEQLPPFDKEKVKLDEEPAKAQVTTSPSDSPVHKPTPAEIVAAASGGKFTPKQEQIADALGAKPEELEIGEVNVDDIPY